MNASLGSIMVLVVCATVGMANPSLAQQATSANQPPMLAPQADPCLTRPCFKPSNTAPTGVDMPPPPPRDLTLQYPGETALSPEDVASVAGATDKLTKAALPAINQVAGAVGAAAADSAASGLDGFKFGVDVYDAAQKGYDSDRTPGAIVGVAKVVTAKAAGCGAAAVVTAITDCPTLGLAASDATEALTLDVLNRPLPAPSDTGIVCAKVGECGVDTSNLNAAIDDAVSSTIQNTNQQFDAAANDASRAQAVSGGDDSSANSTRQSSQPSALDSMISGIQAFQMIQSAGHRPAPTATTQQRALPFVACYIYKGPKSDASVPLCNACCTSDGRQTYVQTGHSPNRALSPANSSEASDAVKDPCTGWNVLADGKCVHDR
jgi:hypothetical protein